jgi:hypothetical protein
MQTDIERIIQGLKILAKYKPDANPACKSNATWMMELQEEAFGEISESDRGQLRNLGWRCRASAPYCWFLLTSRGLAAERDTPSMFA